MRSIFTCTVVAGLLGLATLSFPNTATSAAEAADVVPEGIEVQARGQLHEAYGEPTQTQATEGVLVERAPPDPIEEAPPEEKPAGDDVAWVPGYWNWDDEAKDFVWISGFWRVLPPDRTWVPGHWAKVTGGYRFISGYWSVASAAEETHDVEYLPPPPALVENGPSVPAPDTTSTYVPGCWLYQVNRYLWKPGYWLGHRPGWVWVPSCYRWTPAGYLFVRGYWDRPLLERGMLFAPVRFTKPIYREKNFVYRPSYLIQPDFLVSALFVRTGHPTYYFGDYFTPAYQKQYVPWNKFQPNRFTSDVNFSYYRHTHVGHPAWEKNLTTLYSSRYAGNVPRPPRTLVQQTRVINDISVKKTTNVMVHKNINITNIQNQTVLAPVKSVKNVRITALSSLAGPATGGKTPALPAARDIRVDRASKERLATEKKAVTRYQAISRERSASVTKLAPKAPVKPAAPVKVKLALPKGTPAPRVVRPPKGIPVVPPGEIRHKPPPPKGGPIKPKPPVPPAPKPKPPA